MRQQSYQLLSLPSFCPSLDIAFRPLPFQIELVNVSSQHISRNRMHAVISNIDIVPRGLYRFISVVNWHFYPSEWCRFNSGQQLCIFDSIMSTCTSPLCAFQIVMLIPQDILSFKVLLVHSNFGLCHNSHVIV